MSNQNLMLGNNVSANTIGGSMQRGQSNQQHQNIDTFYRPSVVNAECIIGSGEIPDAGIKSN